MKKHVWILSCLKEISTTMSNFTQDSCYVEYVCFHVCKIHIYGVLS